MPLGTTPAQRASFNGFTVPRMVRCKVCKMLRSCTKHEVLGNVCGSCVQMHSYNAGNSEERGGACNMQRFSFEFEVNGDYAEDLQQALLLVKYGFMQTSDVSVGAEYKSPICSDLRALGRVWAVLDSLSGLVDSSCGTHIHVDIGSNRHFLSFVQDHRNEIFADLLDHMVDNEEETRRFWGRYFTGYAMADLHAGHCACINLETRYSTIEWRLARYRNADQYRRVIQFCRFVVTDLLRQYAGGFNTAKAAKRIVKLYKKALASAEPLRYEK